MPKIGLRKPGGSLRRAANASEFEEPSQAPALGFSRVPRLGFTSPWNQDRNDRSNSLPGLA